jgi:hypothetical protein
MVDAMGAAKRGQLGAVLGDAFPADRPGLRGEVDPGETGGDIGGVVLAGAALLGAEPLHALQHGVGRDKRRLRRLAGQPGSLLEPGR